MLVEQWRGAALLGRPAGDRRRLENRTDGTIDVLDIA